MAERALAKMASLGAGIWEAVELRGLGVVQPSQWGRAYFSPFPAELARDMTLD